MPKAKGNIRMNAHVPILHPPPPPKKILIRREEFDDVTIITGPKIVASVAL
jgi:hypothetical protein